MIDDEYMITVKIPGRPTPYDRATSAINRRTGRPMRTHSKKYRDWRKAAAKALAYQRHGFDPDQLLEVAIVVEADQILMQLTALEDRRRPTGIRGDIDNYVKAALDAAQEAGLITNDSQVQTVRATFRGFP